MPILTISFCPSCDCFNKLSEKICLEIIEKYLLKYAGKVQKFSKTLRKQKYQIHVYQLSFSMTIYIIIQGKLQFLIHEILKYIPLLMGTKKQG